MRSGESPSSERLRLWLERGESGFHLRDAATGEPVSWSDSRVRVVSVAGVSFREGTVEVPRDVAPELAVDEQAVSLWRVEGGLRVLIVPAGAWVGTPR